jgi:hypothetical protein
MQVIKEGNRFRKLIEIHHIKEKNEGGSNTEENLVPVCSSCHSRIHLGLINPKKWYFTTSGWKLEWIDDLGKTHYGRGNISINR